MVNIDDVRDLSAITFKPKTVAVLGCVVMAMVLVCGAAYEISHSSMNNSIAKCERDLRQISNKLHQLSLSPGASLTPADAVERGSFGHPSEATARSFGWPGPLKMSFASKGKTYKLRVPPGRSFGASMEAFFMVHGLERLRPRKGAYIQHMIDLTKQLVARANPALLQKASSGVIKKWQEAKKQGRPATVAAASPGEAFHQASE